MNYRERMIGYLKEPDEHSSQYGKWGILNEEQRHLIRRLLREMDSADEVIKHQYFEIERLNNIISKVKLDINNMKEIIRQQPSEDSDTDEWIINRLNGLLYIIKGSDKD